MTVRRFVSNSSRETIAIGGEIAQLLQSPTLSANERIHEVHFSMAAEFSE